MVGVAILALTSCASANSPPLDTIGTYLERTVPFGFAGIVAASLGPDEWYTAAFGTDARGDSIRRNDPFPLASLVKQFTAAAILHLEQGGSLRVTDRISDHLPGVPADKADITLHQLLTHTAGVSDAISSSTLLHTKEDALAAIFASPLDFPVGEDQQYSNAGFTLLAAVVEEASGTSFHDYLHAEFFVPLGMESTYPAAANFPVVGVGTDRNEQTDWRVVGAGGLVSSTMDLGTWIRALEHGTVLDSTSAQRLWTQHEGNYGYGWRVAESERFGRVVWHDGDEGDNSSSVRRYVDRGLTVIYFDPRRLRGSVLNKVVLLGLGESVTLPPAVSPAAPESASFTRMAGSFLIPEDEGEGQVDLWFEDGAIWIGGHGQSAVDGLEGHDQSAAEAARTFNLRTTAIVGGLARRDFAPVVEAFNPRVPPALIESEMGREWEEFEQLHGPFVSATVLGTARSGRGSWYTHARLRFERGSEVYRFEWNDDSIDGIRSSESLPRGAETLPASRRYVPTTDTQLVTYDLGTERSVVIDFVERHPQGIELRLTTSTGSVRFRKGPP